MATTVVLTGVVKAASGKCYINFAGGAQLEFAALEDVQTWARQPDNSTELTQQLCVAYALARSEDLANVASVRNKSFTFDLTNNSPIRVQ